MMRGEHPAPPIAKTIGFTIAEIEVGRATVLFDAEERHHSPLGTLHGGVFCDIADAAMGMAYISSLEEGESFTTLELKINFLKQVRTGRLAAAAKVVKGGKTVDLVECDITDATGALVARASCTCLTLRGARAAKEPLA
jgi:uncharacterized protein (TIGR00369 family)